MRATAIFLSLFLTVTAAFAADERVIVLSPQVTYRDLDVACESEPTLPRLFLTLQRDGERIVTATLRKAGLASFGPALVLTAEEIAGITTVTENGEVRLDRLPVSSRLLLWILAQSATSTCSAATRLASAGPTPYTFLFDSPATAMEPAAAWSRVGLFEGTTLGNKPYSARIRLYQRPFPL